MQEQIDLLDAIQIGSMSLKLSPSGGSFFDPNLSKIHSPLISICNVKNLTENEKLCANFNAVYVHAGQQFHACASVGAGCAAPGLPLRTRHVGERCRRGQRLYRAAGAALTWPAISCRVGE
jgi:hypothetical protein